MPMILPEGGFESLQRSARSRDSGDWDSGVVAIAVGGPDRVLAGARGPGDVVAA